VTNLGGGHGMPEPTDGLSAGSRGLPVPTTPEGTPSRIELAMQDSLAVVRRRWQYRRRMGAVCVWRHR